MWHSGRISLTDASSVCRSGIGELLGPADCSKIGDIMTVLNLAAFAGAVLLVRAAVSRGTEKAALASMTAS